MSVNTAVSSVSSQSRSMRRILCRFNRRLVIINSLIVRLTASLSKIKLAEGPPCGGFQSGIDGLSSWLMRIIKEVGHGAALQALRERGAREERAHAGPAALLVQRLRPE